MSTPLRTPGLVPAAAGTLSLAQLLEGLRLLRGLGPMGLAMLKRLPAMKGAPKDLLTPERLAGLERALTAMSPAELAAGEVSPARLDKIAGESGMPAEQLAAMLDMVTEMRARGGG